MWLLVPKSFGLLPVTPASRDVMLSSGLRHLHSHVHGCATSASIHTHNMRNLKINLFFFFGCELDRLYSSTAKPATAHTVLNKPVSFL